MEASLENAPFPFARDARCPFDLVPQVAEFRKADGIKKVTLWNGNSAWLATRWSDVRAILSSPDFCSNAEHPNYPAVSASRAAQAKSYKTIFTMDPPEHGRFRRMLTKDFTVKRMQELRPLILDALEKLFDEMENKGAPADFIDSVALSLPSLVVSMLLGVPYEDRAQLQEWSRKRMSLTTTPAQVEEAARLMQEYFNRLFAEREKVTDEPQDLVTRLAVEQVVPGNITRRDAILMCNILYIAGHETTAHQIGLGVLELLRNPRKKAILTQSAENIRKGVEEMLRYFSVVHLHNARVCSKDTVIGGQEIKAGDGVLALLSGGNRDPEQFDQPDVFDVERDVDQHLAFGYGIHQCIGQALARLELQLVFERVFKRFPDLTLAVPFESLKYTEDATVYGLETLPVRW